MWDAGVLEGKQGLGPPMGIFQELKEFLGWEVVQGPAGEGKITTLPLLVPKPPKTLISPARN